MKVVILDIFIFGIFFFFLQLKMFAVWVILMRFPVTFWTPVSFHTVAAF